MDGKKWRERLDRLFFVGYFTPKEAEEKGMRLVIGKEGKLFLYWLVDETDGVIADAKFQVFGPPALILAAEIASELVLRKNYHQASRISADLIDRQLQDKQGKPAFSPEMGSFLNQVLSAMTHAVDQCIEIPCAATHYEETPIAWDANAGGGVADWESRSKEEKLAILHEVIDKEVRPYIELDEGGVTIEDLKENNEVHIAYQGSCTSCHSATGSTLTAIQQILKTRVHPALTVIPIL
ncbi:MAG: NifU family protein [Chlamydiia bacterium]|nr:NifU family protein [Chlamydiia bacterium]